MVLLRTKSVSPIMLLRSAFPVAIALVRVVAPDVNLLQRVLIQQVMSLLPQRPQALGKRQFLYPTRWLPLGTVP